MNSHKSLAKKGDVPLHIYPKLPFPITFLMGKLFKIPPTIIHSIVLWPPSKM